MKKSHVFAVVLLAGVFQSACIQPPTGVSTHPSVAEEPASPNSVKEKSVAAVVDSITPAPGLPAGGVVGRVQRQEAEKQPAAMREQVYAARAREGWRKLARSVAADALQGLPAPLPRQASEALDREIYAHYQDNPVRRVAEDPVSTFSIDVDTGAYSNVRRLLNQGRLPARDAVRVEELINYFAYDYPAPDDAATPFNVITELGPAPWNPDARLLHVGIKGYEMPVAELPPANLVFLVDVSGSMRSPDKLGLLKSSLKLLAGKLRSQDRIAMAVYAGGSGVVLESISGDRKGRIRRAIDGLTAGGSTNGAAGIRLAYQLAREGFIEGGINRVLLATDGDFNVGTVNFQALKDLVAEQRKSGVSLTTLGFGGGNYNDRLMEQLADTGNGHYAYIDTLQEARKVLVEEVGSTLRTVARDVKIQIEFNPAEVAEYRLIGYENRALRREDFNNDKVDAGEIGAGHTVTALYELVLTDSATRRIDELRYARESGASLTHRGELAHLRLRYKAPEGGASQLMSVPLRKRAMRARLADTSERFRFSAAVAGFGQLLRGGNWLADFGYQEVLELARSGRGEDRFGYRGEFLGLVGLAESLSLPEQPEQPGSAG